MEQNFEMLVNKIVDGFKYRLEGSQSNMVTFDKDALANTYLESTGNCTDTQLYALAHAAQELYRSQNPHHGEVLVLPIRQSYAKSVTFVLSRISVIIGHDGSTFTRRVLAMKEDAE